MVRSADIRHSLIIDNLYILVNLGPAVHQHSISAALYSVINVCKIVRFLSALQVEEQVLHFIRQQNRPFNSQLVADNLAQFGLKKGPIQKALDSLSDSSKIRCKVGCRLAFIFYP